ncbi:hypothetical protein ACWCPQ_29535 [Nocardia sp. NPDC001965]
MITGNDVVLVAPGPIPAAIERFLDRWSQKWPQLLVASGTDENTQAFFSPWTPATVAWGELTDEILVARDEAMLTAWDEDGYALDGRDEGPFMLMYSPLRWKSLQATALEDPYIHLGGFIYEPYEITVVGSELWMITVVVPEEGVFGRSVVDTLIACLGSDRTDQQHP